MISTQENGRTHHVNLDMVSAVLPDGRMQGGDVLEKREGSKNVECGSKSTRRENKNRWRGAKTERKEGRVPEREIVPQTLRPLRTVEESGIQKKRKKSCTIVKRVCANMRDGSDRNSASCFFG